MKITTSKFIESLLYQIGRYQNRFEQKPRKFAIKLLFFIIKSFNSLQTFKKLNQFKDDYIHVGILIKGGIGDFCYSAKFVSSIKKNWGNNCKIDVICDDNNFENAKLIFIKNSDVNFYLRKLDYKYDVLLSLIRFPEVISFRRSRLDIKSLDYVKAILSFNREFCIGKTNILENDYLGRKYSQLIGNTRENQADVFNLLDMKNLDFNLDYILPPNHKEIYEEFCNKNQLDCNNLFLVQTGAGKHFNFIHNNSDTRQWKSSYYTELITLFKKEKSPFNFVQLGTKSHSKIVGVDLDLRGKTDFDLFCIILKYSKILVSQEGGSVILRHFLSKEKSVVLFGPTDPKFFGFSENINICLSECSCEWISKNWMFRCIKNNDGEPECMKKITPRFVFNVIKNEFSFKSTGINKK